jgi:hypothetical protein
LKTQNFLGARNSFLPVWNGRMICDKRIERTWRETVILYITLRFYTGIFPIEEQYKNSVHDMRASFEPGA